MRQTDQTTMGMPSPDSMEAANRIAYNKMHVTKSTFLGGQSNPVHRWFRLTPSFGPELVDVMLDRMNTQNHHRVLDPFSGAGTTLYQCKFNGMESFGFEINPFLHFVCNTSVRLSLSATMANETFSEIDFLFHERMESCADAGVEELGIPLPPIHNLYRWWRPDVLKDLLVLKSSIAQASHPAYRDFFNLGLAGVLIPDLTNVTLGRLQLHFVDKSDREIRVWETFAEHVRKMIEDLEQLDETAISTPATVFHTDATTLKGVSIPEQSIDRVVTSPPYPNRYSYVWNTRPFLYFFDFFSTGREAGELDERTIGGTWGLATSVLDKGVVEPVLPIVERIVSPIVEEIRTVDNLMANYVMKYFNLLALQIIRQDRLLAPQARCAYVVGCSRIKGVYVETDRLLGDLFEGLDLGFKVQGIDRFRNRHSGEKLHESIVYADKG